MRYLSLQNDRLLIYAGNIGIETVIVHLLLLRKDYENLCQLCNAKKQYFKQKK